MKESTVGKTPPPGGRLGREPQWPTILEPLLYTGEWETFGPYGSSYARSLMSQFRSGAVKLPAGTRYEQWEMTVRYTDENGKPSSARAAVKSVLWIRWAGRKRQAPKPRARKTPVKT